MDEEIKKHEISIQKIKANSISDAGCSIGNGIAWAGFWIALAVFFHR